MRGPDTSGPRSEKEDYMRAMIFALIALATMGPERSYDQYSESGMYSVWAEPGLHLMMDDNGTPDDYSDDWVIDYEDNRTVKIAVLD